MKYTLSGILLLLLALSVIAWQIRPDQSSGGKTVLVWVSDDNPGRRAQIALFNRLHPNIEVRLDPANSGAQKVIVQVLGGVGPDLFDSYGPADLTSFVKAGIAWDVTDQLAAHGVHLEQDAWPAALPYCETEKRCYGTPTNACVNVVMYNKDVFDKCGISYPTGQMSWTEFIALAQRLTIKDENGKVQQFGFSYDPWMWRMFLVEWGGRVYSDDGTRCVVDSPQAIAGVQFMHDLMYTYHVMPSPSEEAALASEGGWGTSTMKWLGSGRIAMAQAGRWWLCTLRNSPEVRLGAFPMPLGPSGQYWGYGRATLINKNSLHRDAALQFLLYETGKEYNHLVNQQADGLAPIKRFCTAAELPNPAYSQEDYHQVFRDAMPLGIADVTSQFVNDAAVNQILNDQLDLVKRDAKSPADAMQTAARQVNDLIRINLERDPALRSRYQAILANGGHLQ